MLRSAGQKILVGVVAGTILNLAAPVWAAQESGYVTDSSGTPVLSSDPGCLLAPGQPKAKPFEQCGDILEPIDKDGDGVPNDKDKCPNTPKGVPVDEIGCPIEKDSDGDGVPDSVDTCPDNTPEEISAGVDQNGCPRDGDNDGVLDYRDDCPHTKPEDVANVKPNGCVDVSVVFKLKSELYFDFDKATLKGPAKSDLAAYVQELQRSANIQGVEILGYADKIGTDAYNQRLSERRAQTVADYLISQGIPAGKITIKGLGESQATGRTAAERAKDRRVEAWGHVEK